MKKHLNIRAGISYGLLACFYWSIVFVVPTLLSDFNNIDIVLTRYTIFGLASLISALSKRKWIFTQFQPRIWLKGIFWALLINPIYYFGITLSIHYVGAPVTVIIAGLAPIAILFYSNIVHKQIPYLTLLSISSIIFAGVLLTNIAEFESNHTSSFTQYFVGLLSVVLSTAIWVFYVIMNKRVLNSHAKLSPEIWSNILGISSLIICPPLLVLANALHWTNSLMILQSSVKDLLLFFVLCGILGIFSSSWAVSYWNKATLCLPQAFLGGLLIFEPIFGLILTYLVKQSLPSLQEATGILLMLTGSLISLILFGKRAANNAHF